MTVERVNTLASRMVLFGWFTGLAYYNWFTDNPIHVPLWAHAILVVVGMFAASIIIGGGLAFIAAGITKILTGRGDGDPIAYSWAAFLSIPIAFVAAKYALRFFSNY